MFFFFEQFKRGQVCEIAKNDPRHETMPNLFPDRIGERVVIDKIDGDYLWCYDDVPVKYRINRNGKKTIDSDPRCVTSLYHYSQLKRIEAIPRSKISW
ncbi:hypothetical protein J2TS6_42450 [Paenibacillus albilobatus]|uniref:Uncharacterized protein n=1 Tax=Paenibacillus albilobatus TaxID=2716884 RepID=A0A919XJW2_9BACL|nr:hypothetical protein J2TS6_42450 [Paenibacillus albilobatus]